MRGEFVDLAGARIYYYAAGTRGVGNPVVFVHGFPTSSHLWNDVVPLMPGGHRLVVLDLLGFGRSDRPMGRDLSLRGHAERVLGLMDALGISRACVVGHDVGGGVAQLLATRWPQRVSHLCLIDSVAFDAWPAREVKLARAMLPLTRHLPPSWLLSIVRRDLCRGYVDEARCASSIERYVKPFVTADGRDALVAHMNALDSTETIALEARLGSIVCPTSILWGEHDPFLPSSIAKRLHSAIPGSTLAVLPSARHFLPEEAPEQVAETVERLIREP
ncbi:MAG TPA: alpha/beta hydrolase [Gemmatimonadaceae bacterium]|nr:alpha/beta hydrolase [Gemmatimonadaceae bacterium]